MLFADVRPEPGDRSPLFTGRRRVPQPCPAFRADRCACVIYPDRPTRCRQFECRQLLAVRSGQRTVTQALAKINLARRLGARLEKELSALGFNDPRLPLQRRFQRCQRAAETGRLDTAQWPRLAKAQFLMHRLTLLRARDFYG
jgi:Fe-S-cluster containining protein